MAWDDPAQLVELERFAMRCAERAGELILHERPADLGVAATKSSPIDVVTVMDRRSEQLLQGAIVRQRPDDGILGEEGSHRPSRSGITWVLDPIDGTVNYLYRIPQYAVSVAACAGDVSRPGEWQPVATAVMNPETGQLFHARLGGGAFVRRGGRDEELHVRGLADLSQALVATGFGYREEVRRRQGEVAARLLPRIRDLRRMGSAALDLCAVAAGTVDAYYESGINAWDQAGGQLVATEAGAVVLGRRGVPAGKELVVAGPAELASALRDLVAG